MYGVKIVYNSHAPVVSHYFLTFRHSSCHKTRDILSTAL